MGLFCESHCEQWTCYQHINWQGQLCCLSNIPVGFLELRTEKAYLRIGEPLYRIVLSECDETMFLLFMGGFTTTYFICVTCHTCL